jgi:3-oxoacyl-[acyl-carrier protein] reductase
MSKTILTIGASSGIGKALATKLCSANNIINFSRKQPEIDCANLQHHQLDVLTDELPALDNLDSLVYLPGSINLKPLTSLNEEDLLEDYRINVLGAFRVIKHYIRTLKKGTDPSVVLFSTVAVGQGMPYHTSIAIAKAGIEGLTRTLAAEYAAHVRFNCIAPTITDTPLAKGLLRNEKARENLAQRHPLKRIVEADEIADMAAFLLSDKARSISGQVIGIDAGLSSLRA